MLRRMLRLVAALTLVFPVASDAIPVAAQSAGFLVQYEGTLTLTGAPAPAGTTIRAVAATKWSDMIDCGQAKVDTQGHYALRVTNAQCVTTDMNHVPVQHYFIVNGENVGGYEGAMWLNLPHSLGKVFFQKLNGTGVSGPSDIFNAGPPPTPTAGQPQPEPESPPSPPADQQPGEPPAEKLPSNALRLRGPQTL